MLKFVIKKVLYFIVRFYNTIEWFARVIIKTDLRNHIPKIKNEKLISILANGPSLKEELESINFECGDFCVVNDFYKSPYWKIIKPQYCVLADPNYFKSPERIYSIINNVEWNMKLFIPYSALKLENFPWAEKNGFVEYIPYHYESYDGFEFLRFYIYKKGLSMPLLYNVLQPSIFNAINMGYKEIRLYGVDHSWTENIRVNEENQVCLVDRHFYDVSHCEMKPWKKTDGFNWKMYEILRDLSKSFFSYNQVKEYADKKGCRIVNYTHNSYIDAFDRA